MRVALVAAVMAVGVIACFGKIDEGGGASGGASGGGGGGGSGGGSGGAGVEVLAEIDGSVGAMAVDEAYVYVTRYAGTIVRVARRGGTAETIGSGVGMALGLAVDDAHVYWTSLTGREVGRFPKGGGPVELYARTQRRPHGIAVDDAHVYWVNEGSVEAGGSADDGELARAPKAGGPKELLAVRLQAPRDVTRDRDGSLWLHCGPWGGENGAAYAVPPGGGALELLARGLGLTSEVARAGGALAFVSQDDRALYAVRSPLAERRRVGGGTYAPSAIAPDGDGVLAFREDGGRVALERVTLDGARRELAAWTPPPGFTTAYVRDAVVAGPDVYWIEEWASADGMRAWVRALRR